MINKNSAFQQGPIGRADLTTDDFSMVRNLFLQKSSAGKEKERM